MRDSNDSNRAAADTRPGDESLRHTLGQVVSAMDIPFGYTLTVWSAGVMAVGKFGFPSMWGVLSFVGGGIIAYVAIAVVAIPGMPGAAEVQRPRVAVANIVSLVAAVVAAGVSRLVSSPFPGFLVMGFAATLTYPLLLTLLTWLTMKLDLMPGGKDTSQGGR